MTIVLVRHAEPVARGDPRYEDNERPLSKTGARQAAALAEQLAGSGVAALYTSPYPRARETVEPLAQRLGLAPIVVDDLRERFLGDGPLPDWLDHVRRSWSDVAYAPPGGESSEAAERRVRRVLETVAERHRGSVAVIASHGNLIALALRSIAPAAVDFAFWQAMPMPAVYTLDDAGGVTGPGFALNPGVRVE